MDVSHIRVPSSPNDWGGGLASSVVHVDINELSWQHLWTVAKNLH